MAAVAEAEVAAVAEAGWRRWWRRWWWWRWRWWRWRWWWRWRRRWRWRWRRLRFHARVVDTDVVRVRALRAAVLDEVAEREAPRHRRRNVGDGGGERCPHLRVSALLVGRVDVEQQMREVTDVGRGRADIGAVAGRARTDLEPVGIRIGLLYRPRPERHRVPVLNRNHGRQQPVADRAYVRRVVEVGRDVRRRITRVRLKDDVNPLEPVDPSERLAVIDDVPVDQVRDVVESLSDQAAATGRRCYMRRGRGSRGRARRRAGPLASARAAPSIAAPITSAATPPMSKTKRFRGCLTYLPLLTGRAPRARTTGSITLRTELKAPRAGLDSGR